MVLKCVETFGAELTQLGRESGWRVSYRIRIKTHFFFLLLTGAVSLACTDSGLWAVEGGNKLVCSGLLQASKSNLISGSVMSIEEKTRTKQTGELEFLFYCS